MYRPAICTNSVNDPSRRLAVAGKLGRKLNLVVQVRHFSAYLALVNAGSNDLNHRDIDI